MPLAAARTGSRTRYAIYTLLICLIVSGVTLGLGELMVRLKGFKPAKTKAFSNEPVLLRHDSRFGWKPVPGNHVFDAYAPGQSRIQLTLWPDGSRATGRTRKESPIDIAFVGCSYTQGWAVSDPETFAWMVQERLPGKRVENFGVGGFSTYQAFIKMKELVESKVNAPKLFVYGFYEAHEMRNVATGEWYRSLLHFHTRNHRAIPYVKVDNEGSLHEVSPERLPAFPLREKLALMAFLETSYIQLRTSGRDGAKRYATQQLMLKMRQYAEENGIAFLVVNLENFSYPSYKAYKKFFQESGLRSVDCVRPDTHAPELRVPGDGHPNGRHHALWADCMMPEIVKELAARMPSR